MSDQATGKFRFGPFHVDTFTGELRKGETRLRLVGQPFQILAVLLSKPGEVVTRQELRSRLWADDTFVDFNHGLNAAVNKLREALCDSADDPRYVETVPRRGYRFIARVEAIGSGGEPALSAPVFEANRVILGPEVPSRKEDTVVHAPHLLAGAPEPVRSRWWRPPHTALAAILALLLGGTLLSLFILPGEKAPASATLAHHITPLTHLTDATSHPAFSPNGSYVAFVRGGYRLRDSGVFLKEIGGDSLMQLTRSTRDCCPAWSPDGKWIAFARETNGAIGIYLVPTVPAAGGAERKLTITGATPRDGELDWSPDGKTIAFSAGSIASVSLADSSVRRITEPTPDSRDWGPAFSPDGRKILFVRQHEMQLPAEVMEVAVDGRSLPVTIATEHARIMGSPCWSADGKTAIYATDRGSQPALWRVSAERREAPVEIAAGGWNPAVSRRGYRFAYERITRNLSVLEMDVPKPAEKRVLIPSTSPTDQGPGPQFSPDGTKLAYMSDRSGTMEIWVSDSDGGNAYQLTAVDGAGTPRWSPNGNSIVFDTHGGIFAVEVKGGAARAVVKDQFSNVCPSWSRDGKWIYFASYRGGKFQVFKVGAGGGAPVQVTTRGGHAALPSLDGKYLYYAKTEFANPEIWQVPVGGGTEKIVSPLLRPATWASWGVVRGGIVFAGPSGNGKPAVSLFDFGKRRVTTIGELDVVPFWLGATMDGRSIVFDQPGWQQPQVMLEENFR